MKSIMRMTMLTLKKWWWGQTSICLGVFWRLLCCHGGEVESGHLLLTNLLVRQISVLREFNIFGGYYIFSVYRTRRAKDTPMIFVILSDPSVSPRLSKYGVSENLDNYSGREEGWLSGFCWTELCWTPIPTGFVDFKEVWVTAGLVHWRGHYHFQ